MDPQVNPFAVLSFIVAPAVLTNASSVLSMSTNNRLARAVDRTHELARQLEAAGDLSVPAAVRRCRELAAAEQDREPGDGDLYQPDRPAGHQWG